MSGENLFLNNGFVRAPLQNGVGRYVRELECIVLKFCKRHRTSRDIRDYIFEDLIDYAKENPDILIHLKPRRHHSPVILREYSNGDRLCIDVHNKTQRQIATCMEILRTQQSEVYLTRLTQYQYTYFPAIPRPWPPLTFGDPQLQCSRLAGPIYWC